ncbi:MAG: hypothetical protein CVV27_00120 [Candidatus Melainabacteria bacterium HGW-Melainabacteria-1]|nr:MAG: hypothetical protein CVV27_00120 [Candidatus Melainabacteria bacterium HGW-Melainabacteria-1]
MSFLKKVLLICGQRYPKDMKTTTSSLRDHLRPGQVYRRQELGTHSRSVDRELQALVQSGLLKKAYYGIYYCPKQSRFGELPPEGHDLIRAFLKTDDFLAFSPNKLNGLCLGSTQLSNVIRVYNHKRQGIFTLAGQRFEFRIRPEYPKELTVEFLFVEFLNERPNLPEEVPLRPERLKDKLQELDQRLVAQIIRQFGKSYTKKIYAALTTQQPASLPPPAS